jgi:hypothetical protein
LFLYLFSATPTFFIYEVDTSSGPPTHSHDLNAVSFECCPASMDTDVLDPAEVEAKNLVDEIRKKHTSVVHEELEIIVNDLLHL